MQDLLEVSAGLARTHAFTAHELAQLIRRVAELRQQPIGRLARWAKMVLVSASMPLEKCNLNPTLLLKYKCMHYSQVPFAGVLSSASPADIAAVCSCLPHLLDSVFMKYDSTSQLVSNGAYSLDNKNTALSSSKYSPSNTGIENVPALAQNPSLFQPVMMLASSAVSSFKSMSSRQLYQTVIGLASVGFPAGPNWLESHAIAVSEVAMSELSEAECEAIEKAYTRMRQMRAMLRERALTSQVETSDDHSTSHESS